LSFHPDEDEDDRPWSLLCFWKVDDAPAKTATVEPATAAKRGKERTIAKGERMSEGLVSVLVAGETCSSNMGEKKEGAGGEPLCSFERPK
jgi:hypothetical protein